ncbi:MAG: hypothetical protein FJX74_19065 [Armatimonadetes bacterium]|nr:hypothetical protein [Armatimonadota bacterium]
MDAPRIDTVRSDGREIDLPLLSASASISPDGQSAALTLTNRSLAEPMAVKLDWIGIKPPETITARVLTADSPAAHNTAEEPEAVTVRECEVGAEVVEVPAMGVVAVGC